MTQRQINEYQLGRLMAIAETVAPQLQRHFNKFMTHPVLLFPQLYHFRVTRTAFLHRSDVAEIIEAMQSYPTPDGEELFPNYSDGSQLVAGLWHQRHLMGSTSASGHKVGNESA
jgi:hypothetical protein